MNVTEDHQLATTGRGYEEFRRRGREGAGDAIKHHRLLALAWGLIDSLDDWHDIDHRVEVGWLNVEQNLRAKPPSENYQRARQRAADRLDQPEEYCIEDVEEVLTA